MEFETEHAVLVRSGPLVVQRWKSGITLDSATIRATMLARHDRFGDQPYVMIVVVPEGTNYAMSFLEHDQYAGTPVETSIVAMANVVEDEEVRAIVSLYYAQHPPRYAFAVFARMVEAEAWARAKAEQRKDAGHTE